MGVIQATTRNLVVASFVIATGCETSPPADTAEDNAQLPDSFAGATPVDLLQKPCSGDAYEDVPLELDAFVSEDLEVYGTFRHAAFRCAQDVCGYALTDDDGARVLFQPCEMNPEEVAGCDCRYDIEYLFESSQEADTLSVYTRPDFHAGEEDETLAVSAAIENPE